MYPPIPEQLSFRLKSSMYKLKSIGEIIPPCFTPFVTQKLVEHVLSQRTNILWREYQKTSNLAQKFWEWIFLFRKKWTFVIIA